MQPRLYPRVVRPLSLLAVLAVLASACGEEPVGTPAAEGCAHVVAATAERDPAGTYRFDVTVRSADTGWDKYADAWEVRSPDGTVLGTRTLLHPHVDEQPFTRSLTGVEIPGDVTGVVIAARDSVDGFCGDTFAIDLP